MRRIIAIAAALLGIGYFAAPVAAQTIPTTTTIPGGSTTTVAPKSTIPGGIVVDGPLTLSPASGVTPGSKVTVSATGLKPGAFTLHLISQSNPSGIVLGTATVPASGSITTEVVIPANTAAGTWFIRGYDETPKFYASSFSVTAATGATTTTVAATPGALPNNGPLATLPMIVAAVVVGFGGLVMARRTNRA